MDKPGEKVRENQAVMLAPYCDLNDSIEVARVVFNRGGGTCTNDQLVAWLNYKNVTSGAYVTRVSAARKKYFDLIVFQSGKFSVTPLGRQIVAPVSSGDAESAKAEAFLKVPLFKKVFDEFRGKPLPAEEGLKNLFENYGIVKERVRPAVRVFLNSAEQAGFFKTSGDRSRLVQPVAYSDTAGTQSGEQLSSVGAVSDVAASQEPSLIAQSQFKYSEINPAILGLLQKLPTGQGVQWTQVEKVRFLSAFNSAIEFLYPARDDGELS
jgi:hypothetical protein